MWVLAGLAFVGIFAAGVCLAVGDINGMLNVGSAGAFALFLLAYFARTYDRKKPTIDAAEAQALWQLEQQQRVVYGSRRP